jgi:tetratricopeptide (TPR) repeat protein
VKSAGNSKTGVSQGTFDNRDQKYAEGDVAVQCVMVATRPSKMAPQERRRGIRDRWTTASTAGHWNTTSIFKTAIMDHVDVSPPVPSSPPRWHFVAVNAVAAAILGALVCLVQTGEYMGWLGAGWHSYSLWLWVVTADLAVTLLLAIWWRTRRGPIAWRTALLPHLLVLGVAGLLAADWFNSIAIWTLELLVCGVVAAAWLIVVGGPVALVIGGVLRSRGEKAILSRRGLRLWVASAAFVGTTEAAVWLIEQPQRRIEVQLTMPERYQEAPHEERPVVALGGSTMLGFPYQPQIGIPEVLGELLRALRPGDPVPVANLAEGGINFQRAADRLIQIEPRPRLLLLYTGHNEYFYDLPAGTTPRRWPGRVCDPLLAWSGLYRWATSCVPQQFGEVQLGPEASIVRRPYMTAELVRRRQEQFRTDLTALAEHCRRHEVPTLWFLPAASEGIFLPNRSVSPRPLSSREERALNERYRHCRRLIMQGEYEPARAQLAELNVRYPRVAELEFWIGVCLRELGQIDAAQPWFRRAIDHDHQPACANSAYRDIIAEVAGQFDIEVIDAEVVLGDFSPTGLRDRHVIHDNVHPTLRAFCELAQAALKSRTVADVFALDQPIPEQVLSFEEILHRRAFTPADLARAYERTAFCFRTLARMRTDWRDRMATAAQYELWADRLARGEIAPGEEGAEALTEDAIPGVRLEWKSLF